MTKEEALARIKELEQFILGNKEIDVINKIEMITVKNLTLTDFKVGKYLVTQQEWEAVMGSNPSYFSNRMNNPVESVSYEDVKIFISNLNFLTKKKFRLPTEHEWLVCATIDGMLYSGSNDINEVAWWENNSGGKTHPVGLLKPNSLGIYDLSGNVWEWCDGRVLRGGSWSSSDDNCRVANRYGNDPDNRSYYRGGFRLAQDC